MLCIISEFAPTINPVATSNADISTTHTKATTTSLYRHGDYTDIDMLLKLFV